MDAQQRVLIAAAFVQETPATRAGIVHQITSVAELRAVFKTIDVDQDGSVRKHLNPFPAPPMRWQHLRETSRRLQCLLFPQTGREQAQNLC